MSPSISTFRRDTLAYLRLQAALPQNKFVDSWCTGSFPGRRQVTFHMSLLSKTIRLSLLRSDSLLALRTRQPCRSRRLNWHLPVLSRGVRTKTVVKASKLSRGEDTTIQQDDVTPKKSYPTVMQQHLEKFTSFHTRYYKSDYGRQSSEWLLDQVNKTLTEAGAGVVRPFTHPWGESRFLHAPSWGRGGRSLGDARPGWMLQMGTLTFNRSEQHHRNPAWQVREDDRYRCASGQHKSLPSLYSRSSRS